MKKRLDIILHERGFFSSREKARTAVMAGCVDVNGNREYKPGAMFPDDCVIEIKENPNPFVSRGGLKLSKALKQFNIDLTGKICADIGASTGGFTDCMLKNGAAKVYSIDVGYGQLAWELRKNEKVINMERTNIRNVRYEDIGEMVDFAAVDVSFISLEKVIPAISTFLKDHGILVCLVKPQFEAGREAVGRKGVVRDRNVHVEVLNRVCSFLSNNYEIRGIDYSPVRGPEGNIEYLVQSVKTGNRSEYDPEQIQRVTEEAHASL